MEVKLIPRELREADFPVARFLSEQEQEAYDKAIKHYNVKARNSLDVNSNIFKVLFLNQIGIRTATLSELEQALENGLDLRGYYGDAREVVLRGIEAPNSYLAKNLAEQLGIQKFENPFVVKGLEIRADENSDYGLRFEKTDKTEVIEVPDLHKGNNKRKFSRVNEDYSIDFDDNGARTLFTRDQGLSWLCLYWGLDLYSDYVNLAVSYSSGRVVVITSEANSQKFLDDYLGKLQQERDGQIEVIKQRYAKAEALLKEEAK